MRKAIGVYETHEKAMKAIETLTAAGYPFGQISLASIHDPKSKAHLNTFSPLLTLPLIIGLIAGPILGALAGMGIISLPLLGSLYGAGAVVGIVAGFDLGLVGGGVATILAEFGVGMAEYEKHWHEGKYLVVAFGNNQEVQRAKGILEVQGGHGKLAMHRR